MPWTQKQFALAGVVVVCIAGVSTWKIVNMSHGENPTQSGANTFYNPILDQGADPWMLSYQNHVYLTMTTGNNVTMYKSDAISDVANGTKSVLWSPTSNHPLTDIWAPELHHIGNRWFVYFAADENQDNTTHRMYVLESAGNKPSGPYRFMGKLKLPDNQWAIDGTILQYNKDLYFIWSGWPDAQHQIQNLYIAKMSSPTTISSTMRSLISQPTYEWERSVAPINEGPEIFQHNGQTFLIYSANASWTNDYSLGMMTLIGDNPLLQSNWQKHDQPVFQSSNGIYGPGHASFVKDGSQNYIVYHAARYSNAGWDRVIRAQPFSFNKNGVPQFEAVSPTTDSISLPAGQSSGWRVIPISKSPTGVSQINLTAKTKGLYTIGFRYRNHSKNPGNVSISLPQLPKLIEPFPGTDGSISIHYMQVYLNVGQNLIEVSAPQGIVIGPSVEVSLVPTAG